MASNLKVLRGVLVKVVVVLLPPDPVSNRGRFLVAGSIMSPAAVRVGQCSWASDNVTNEVDDDGGRDIVVLQQRPLFLRVSH